MVRKQATLRLSGFVITEMFKNTYSEFKDKDFNIRGIEYDPFTDTAKFLLEGETFPELPECMIPPEL